MSWVAAAVAVGGYLLNNNAARSAASQQADAAKQAQEAQAQQLAQSRADNAQYLQTGAAANSKLKGLLGLDQNYTGTDAGSLTRNFAQSDLEADPVYQNGLKFGLDQGTGAINARATQAGSYDSGSTLKALARYANDYGSTKANESYNRFNQNQGNIFNRLSGISGTGQTAVGQVGAAGTNAANNISELQTQIGNAGAAGVIGGANAFNTAGQNYLNYNNQQNQNALLRDILNRQGGSNVVSGGSTQGTAVNPSDWGGGWSTSTNSIY